jgi:hypothetical protein
MTAKQQFIAALKADTDSKVSMAKAILRAYQDGHSDGDMLNWGVEAGYSKASVRSAISRILIGQGFRRNAEGQGRPVSPEAQVMADFAIAEFGGYAKAAKVLRGAMRVAMAKAKAEREAKAAVKAAFAATAGQPA